MTQTQAERLRFLDAATAVFGRWDLKPNWVADDGVMMPILGIDDLFYTATSSINIVRPETVEMLDQAMKDAGRLWGVMLWICRCRRQCPGSHWSFPDAKIAGLFAACEDPKPPDLQPDRSKRWPQPDPEIRYVGPPWVRSRHVPETEIND